MSDDGNITSLHGPPKTPAGRIDRKKCKEIYDRSPHIEWSSFCDAMGWPLATRQRLPVSKWVKEKKRRVAEEHADTLQESAFHYQHKWQKDVINTMQSYPPALDLMKNLVLAKMNRMADIVNQAQKEQVEATARGEVVAPGKSPLDAIKPMDFLLMSNAIRAVTEGKMKALLLDSASLKVAIQPLPYEAEDEDSGEAKEDREWKIKLLGVDGKTAENISRQDLEGLMIRYLDQPPSDDLEEQLEREREEAEAEDPDA